MATETFKNIQIYKSGSTRYSYTMFPSGFTTSNGVQIPTAPVSGIGLVEDSAGNKYFTNNGGSSTCNLSTFSYSNVNYLSENGFIDLGDYVLNSSSSYYLFFPVIYFNSVDPYTYGYKAGVDTKHPIIRSTADTDVNNFCSSVVSTATNQSYTLIYNTFDFDYDSSSSGGGGSTDITPLIPAILMIPATIIVICFFSIIYKMFINKRTRS